mgnify:CR=1 FL=1
MSFHIQGTLKAHLDAIRTPIHQLATSSVSRHNTGPSLWEFLEPVLPLAEAVTLSYLEVSSLYYALTIGAYENNTLGLFRGNLVPRIVSTYRAF